MKLSRRIPLLALLALTPFLSAAQPAPDLPAVTAAVLRARLSGAAPSDQRACFYEQRGYAPAWSDEKGLLPAADDLLAALAAAGDEGLNPADYRTDLLRSFVQQVRSRPAPGDLAEADLLLT